jgi:hypothetical protein
VQDPEVIVVPVLVALPSIVIVIRMWLRHREKMAALGQTTRPSAELEARMQRVEQAVEAIAIEMERVGEGQRFLTKVLTDRLPSLPTSPSSQPQSGRVITPH